MREAGKPVSLEMKNSSVTVFPAVFRVGMSQLMAPVKS